MANQLLEKLHAKRKLWVQSTRDNNFDSGIYKLLTELYPDNAHFIYELLQNAEDAEASDVSFELFEDSLKFKHNGRLFNEADVDGITSIGEGTKADDINKIGKFGVGFKAVFSYTNSPKIYSGAYCFEIHDLVVPHEILSINKKEEETVILFPFNNPNKFQSYAYSEIKKGLEKLQDNTLLFLNNIGSITYYIDNKSFKLRRQKIDNVRVNILDTRRNTSTQWLRFKKKLDYADNLFVSTAFLLEDSDKTNKVKIRPVAGKVSIFFPAEKESSLLKFHIHAPFASTVARDSIKEIEDNNDLRDLLAELMCESLEYLKEKKILDYGFFACLPIADDNLSNFYKPIQNKLIQCFNRGNYLQTDDGGYHRPIKCYRSSTVLKKIISKSDLKIFLGKKDEKNIYWLKNPPQLNSREDKFLQALEINSFNNNDLIETLQEIIQDYKNDYDWVEETNRYRLKKFLKNKDSEWTKTFYEFLYEVVSKSSTYEFYDVVSFNVFIKLKDGQFNYNFNNCYFDSKSNLKKTNLSIVNKEVYETDEKAKNQKSKKFLEELGVSNIGLDDEIHIILQDYNYGNSIQQSELLQHLELFLKYFSENNNTNLFYNKPIFLNSRDKLVGSDDILVDSPFQKTGLIMIAGSGGRHLLNYCYNVVQNKEIFKQFLKETGAHFTLPIEQRGIYNHPNYVELKDYGIETKHKIDEDFFIYKQKQLQEKNFNFSLLVWNTLTSYDSFNYFTDGYISCIFTARYRRNAKSTINKAPSSLLLALKNQSWLPDKNGEFHRPSDISINELHDDFKYNNANGWLTKIEFGNNLLKNQEEYIEKSKWAHEASGLKPETLSKLKEKKISDEKLLQLVEEDEIRNFQKDEIPNLADAIQKHSKKIDKKEEDINPSIIQNEEEYRKKAQEKLDLNISKSRKPTKRYLSSQKIKVGKTETKEFLKLQYKGHCQVCGFTFNRTDNKGNYFETYDWFNEKISKQKTNIIEAGSTLSLCSRCHSVIRNGDFDAAVINEMSTIGDLNGLNFSEFTDLLDSSIETNNVPDEYRFIEFDMYKIPIRLLNEKKNIFYTEEHFLQFFNLLTLNQGMQKATPKEIEHTHIDNSNIIFIELNNKLDNESIQQVEKFENNGGVIESSNNKIRNGSSVNIKYLKTNQATKIKIVQQRISKIYKKGEYVEIENNSPLAKVLIGHCASEIVKMGEKIEILIEDVFNN